MTTLDSTELLTLHAFFQNAPWSTLNDTDRFNKLNEPAQVANPVTVAPQVPAPVYESTIMELLSASSLKNVNASALGPKMLDDINAGNVTGIGIWAAALLKMSLILQSEHDAILAALAATVPDPAWTATIPGPTPAVTLFGAKTWSRADGSVVSFIPFEDVEAAR